MKRSAKILFCVSIAIVLGFISVSLLPSPADAQEAQWIWSPDHEKTEVPQTACHFRKRFTVSSPESGEISIAADDQYEVFVNGRRVGTGGSAEKLDKYDISRFLARGRNLVAIKVSNTDGSTAALAARLMVSDTSRGTLSYSTDRSWVTSLRPLPFWYTPLYNDTRWLAAQSFGMLGRTEPWDQQPEAEPAPQVASTTTQPKSVPTPEPEAQPAPIPIEVQEDGPFQIDAEFQVEQLLDADLAGSLIAMTFNEFGHIVASREGGELLLIYDSDKDGYVDKVREYCDQVTSCQGILCLNGEVFVTGNGPDGTALYRLTDKNRDGRLDEAKTVLKFDSPVDEYGPHGIAMGSDGFLYVTVGSHARPARAVDDDGPHRAYYEGDMVQPRCEDPGGHAAGVKAPGGTILRVSLDGKRLQSVAGGLRNAYDLAFNRAGDLFTRDSDMESDVGTPWYRPTALYQVTAGAEFGWRSGWAKWPEYFIDRLPSTLDTGRGSPTGMVFYSHNMFPESYHDALFMADWSEGRILAVKMKRNGASYTANSEVFLEGDELSITDLDVGPDGGLYFTTGGRGTVGGLYRVKWKGKPPAGTTQMGTGLSAVIRQPQLQSAWARQKIAAVKGEMGDDWDRMIPGVALSSANPWQYRVRALELMQLYGPPLTTDLLVKLSRTENERVRAKAAELMGLHADAKTRGALVTLLNDSDRAVRRKACESLVRSRQTAPVGQLEELLKSDDRFEVWAARRLLMETPADGWRDRLLGSNDHRLVIEGSLALLAAEPGKENAQAVVERIGQLMNGFVTDREFIDMLRVLQVATIRGELTPEDAPQVRELLAEEFPSSDDLMNRELVRLLARLQVSSIMDRYLEYLESDSATDLEKLHLALHLRAIEDGWTTDGRTRVLEFFERAQKRSGVSSTLVHYIMNGTREFAKSMNDEQSLAVLAQGARWPNAALGVLYRMPPEVSEETLSALKDLDAQIIDSLDPATMRLKVGIVAVLARSGDPQSQAYLRELWERDPERRQAVAMGLAQSPTKENWDYLVRSLPILDGVAAREVLVKLRTIDLAPEEPEYYRQVILRGMMLGNKGAADAIALLEYWTQEKHGDGSDNWKDALAAWKEWYADEWPEHLEAKLPEESEISRWRYVDLLRYLTTEEGRFGSAEHGGAVFQKAQCIKCHRFGSQGGDVGPELTDVSRRLMRKQILQSALHPSHVLADQYARKTVVTKQGRKYSGTVTTGEPGQSIIDEHDGTTVLMDEKDIAEVQAEKISPMPEGVLDQLTLKEIADLFAYLRSAPVEHMAETPDETVRE
ncbi:MAG: HEAT repeat domain-containing protein [Planctomycetes bacterium]|nr:HEAT repeat domain-containing protein [Planctomycetota bacterium]